MNYSVKQVVIFWVGFTLLVLMSQGVNAQITPGDPGNFITTWKTDNPGDSDDDQTPSQ